MTKRAAFRNGIQLPNIIIDYELIDLNEVDDEKLVNLRARLEQERTNIAGQLDRVDQKRRAEPDGDFSGESEWEKKARFTREIKGKQIKCIQDEQRRRRIRLGCSLPQVFMDIARAHLASETFEAIYQMAQGKVADEQRQLN